MLTGSDIDGEELLDGGARVCDLQRRFNTRKGMTRTDDMLPERCLRLPEFGEYSAQEEWRIVDYVGRLEEYYESRGRDRETGMPPSEPQKMHLDMSLSRNRNSNLRSQVGTGGQAHRSAGSRRGARRRN